MLAGGEIKRNPEAIGFGIFTIAVPAAAADGRRRAEVPHACAAVRCAKECAVGFPEKVRKNSCKPFDQWTTVL